MARNPAAVGGCHVDGLRDILHVIEPNYGRRWDAFDNQNMTFSSMYFEMGAREDQAPLRKSGFEDNPLLYTKSSYRYMPEEL